MPRPFSVFSLLSVSALMAVAACNPAPSRKAPEKPVEKADSGSFMPVYLPQYPGATVKAQIAAPGGHGGVIVMETPDPVDKVVAFYDARAKESGVRPSTFTTDSDGAVRIYGDSGSASGGLLAISPSDEGPGSEIVLTMGRGGDPEPPEAMRMATTEPLR